MVPELFSASVLTFTFLPLAMGNAVCDRIWKPSKLVCLFQMKRMLWKEVSFLVPRERLGRLRGLWGQVGGVQGVRIGAVPPSWWPGCGRPPVA